MADTHRPTSPRDGADTTWTTTPLFPQEQQGQHSHNPSNSNNAFGFPPPRQTKNTISQQHTDYRKNTPEGEMMLKSANNRPAGISNNSSEVWGGSTSLRDRIDARPQQIQQQQRSSIPPPPPPPPKQALNKIPRPSTSSSGINPSSGHSRRLPPTSGSQSVHSQGSSNQNNATNAPQLSAFATETTNWPVPSRASNNPETSQEQALFEQRLCEDMYGVAVRKINQNGKSNLRYVRCCWVDASDLLEDSQQQPSNRSVSSRRSAFSLKGLRSSSDRSLTDRSEPGFFRRGSHNGGTSSFNANNNGNLIPTTMASSVGSAAADLKVRVLTWGKKTEIMIPLEKFICVRKGKTTDRTRRNTNPASRILSLIADDTENPSLDIEAPTSLDRDKFARAFSKFLNIPLYEEGDSSQGRASSVTSTSKGTF
jgi:hypothetical protein